MGVFLLSLVERLVRLLVQLENLLDHHFMFRPLGLVDYHHRTLRFCNDIHGMANWQSGTNEINKNECPQVDAFESRTLISSHGC
jgi:hypothetical protein